MTASHALSQLSYGPGKERWRTVTRSGPLGEGKLSPLAGFFSLLLTGQEARPGFAAGALDLEEADAGEARRYPPGAAQAVEAQRQVAPIEPLQAGRRCRPRPRARACV